jgi:amidohydrolase
MPILNRVAALHKELIEWRRDMHAHPELLYDVHRTAAAVADKLKSFGCDEVVPGIGRTGVVGVIRGRKPGKKVVGLRADMDALPLEEGTGLPYKSTIAGKMHACGHDGHTTMLLGAAKYLAETRNFAGTAVVIFQPAEEGGAGALAMIKDGLMSRFGIQEVYGMHNYPGMAVGEFAICPGPIMASVDHMTIDLEGKGGHASRPHETIDTLLIGAQIVNQLQTVVARSVDPLKAAVVSICMFQSGHTDNVIPQHAKLRGSVRALNKDIRETVKTRVGDIVEGTAKMYGATAKITYATGYPVLVNHERETDVAAGAARDVAGKVDTGFTPWMGAEDFAFMLEERPGAFIFIGNGDSAGLHHPAYDFNDEAIPVGTSYWVRLAESALGG